MNVPVGMNRNSAQNVKATVKMNEDAAAAAAADGNDIRSDVQEQHVVQGTDATRTRVRLEYELDSPAANLQQLLRFQDADARLHSDTSRRVATNGPSMYAYMRREDLDLCSALETTIATPGTTAMKAIDELKGKTFGWLGPEKATLTAIRMQGYLQDKAARPHANTMLCPIWLFLIRE